MHIMSGFSTSTIAHNFSNLGKRLLALKYCICNLFLVATGIGTSILCSVGLRGLELKN